MRKRILAAVLLIAGAATNSGCRTFGKAVDVIDWTGGAISATADILRASGEDIGSVWSHSGGAALDGLGITEPAKPEEPAKEAE